MLYNINEIYVIKKYCLYNYDINIDIKNPFGYIFPKGVRYDCFKNLFFLCGT